ncbi:hypothetical protein Taro_038146, partial [Colocasia esculenta]|nr:hypothetical protein [Colocasia esculenta]
MAANSSSAASFSSSPTTSLSDLPLESLSLTTNPPVMPGTMSLLTIKLTHENYVRWRRQFSAALRATGYLGIIDGSDVCPPATIPGSDNNPCSNPAHISWQKRDALVLSWMLASMTDSVAALVPECETAHATWTALARALASHSGARVLQLRTQLQSLRRGSSTITEYMQTIKGIADSLTIIGEPVREQDLIMQVLAGLGPSYNTFIPSVTTRIRDVSLEDLHAMLLAHESFMQHCEQSPEEATFPSAHSAIRERTPISADVTRRGASHASSRSSRGRNKGRGRGRGPFCQICFVSGQHYAH